MSSSEVSSLSVGLVPQKTISAPYPFVAATFIFNHHADGGLDPLWVLPLFVDHGKIQQA